MKDIIDMTKLKKIILATVATAIMPVAAFPCTSAIVSASANPSGRPVLWKHRDTSTIDNKVEYVAPEKGAFGYVALFNASDRDLREAWMGMNDAGFAVMNTASYNIKDDRVPQKKMDKEGILMTKALKTCRTVDDFARLLDSYPRPMGVEANFGVIDASGNWVVCKPPFSRRIIIRMCVMTLPISLTVYSCVPITAIRAGKMKGMVL